MKRKIDKFFLYYRTIKFLKFKQIVYRILLKLRAPTMDFRAVPLSPSFCGLTTYPAMREPSMYGPLKWHFLNTSGSLLSIGWQSSCKSKLWRYNQHYFDDLNAINSDLRVSWHRDIIERWIAENSPPHGHGWEAYPTALRIVNWIKWASKGNELSVQMRDSLAIQSNWLSKRLEWHLMGNHLFVNAKALIYSGLFFDGKDAERWLAVGVNILNRQLDEQVLKDGGHFELSTMYHCLILEDILDLINICRINSDKLSVKQTSFIRKLNDVVPKMLSWLKAMSHPDGKISFFNDAAFNIAPSNDELFSYATRLGFQIPNTVIGITDLSETGYVRMENNKVVLIADLADVGPSYIPGHAHADTLSFELSFSGQRLFVNSGTSTYEQGPERCRQRATSQHNTVCVNGQNSSEVWASFRVGERAKILGKQVCEGICDIQVCARHNGYARSFNNLEHQRHFVLSDHYLFVCDSLSRPMPSEARFHCHPNVKISKMGNHTGQIMTEDDKVLDWEFDGVSAVRIDETIWHPEFGSAISNKCLVAEFNNGFSSFKLSW
jgi:uncharacterized heparinase superfamily protein